MLELGERSQTTRDSDVSSAQTLQTAAQLARLSTRLRALVEAGPDARG